MEYIFDTEDIFNKIKIHFVNWASKTCAEKFVVGISGGKDSTVTALLLSRIFGPEYVYGVQLPSGVQSDIQDSEDVINILKINKKIINIGDSVNAITAQLGDDVTYDCRTNLPARIRMSALFAVGQCVNGRVINTCNLSEDMVGYATLFGDCAGTYAPLQSLTVTEVKQLGHWLVDTGDFSNSEKSRLSALIDKTPVDGLQPLSDEEKLGFTYGDLDKFIRLNEGDDEFKDKIRSIYNKNKFKLEIVCMPQPVLNLPNYVTGLTNAQCATSWS